MEERIDGGKWVRGTGNGSGGGTTLSGVGDEVGVVAMEARVGNKGGGWRWSRGW